MRFVPAVVLALLAVASAPACAIQDEIQVYTDDIDKPGENGLEMHINSTPRGRKTPDYPGEVPPSRGMRLTPEFSRGLTQTLEAGLYLPVTTDAANDVRGGGYKLRLKWMPLRGDEASGGWYFGTNHELGWLRKTFSDVQREYELRVIGGFRADRWLIGANVILGRGLSSGSPASPDATVAWKAVREVVHGVSLGAEYYQDIGTLTQRLPREQQGRALYGIVELDQGAWELNLGLGHGITAATDNWTLKAIVGVTFR